VTLTLVPSTIGSVSSPSGSGSGSGTGDTRQAALDQAYRAACSQLGLDNATRSACEQGQDFQVEGGSQGNIPCSVSLNVVFDAVAARKAEEGVGSSHEPTRAGESQVRAAKQRASLIPTG
jgi:hypothetical protein